MRTLKTKLQVTILIAVLVMLIALGGRMPAASAQNNTVLTFDPDLISVPLGNQVHLELWVLEGVNVSAFDIELEYDADVLTLASWSYGKFLKQLSQVMLINEPGHFRLAATQLAQPVVSGSGVLLNFTFNTIALGETPIDLTNGQLSDALGNSIFPALEDALVRVVNEPTYTPTATNTPIPTALPTATPTQTHTSTPTQTSLPTTLPTATSTQAPTSTPTQTSLPTTLPTATSTQAPTLTPVQTSLPTTLPTATSTQALTPSLTATATSLASPTLLWTGTATRINIPPIGGNDEPGEEQYITPVQTSEPWGQAPGEPPEIQGSGEMSGGGTSVELALAPGYEQTAQVAHYATLMAQAEALQAGTLPVENSQDSLETTLWVLLIVGLVILAVLLVIAFRRRRKNN